MIALAMLMVSGSWVKIEPFQPEFLDDRCEISERDHYDKLTGGRRYSSLRGPDINKTLKENILSPSAWKLTVDAYLQNNAGGELLKLIDSLEPSGLEKKKYFDFLICKSYALQVIHAKADYSPKFFGNKSWDSIVNEHRTFAIRSGLTLEHGFDSKEICLADLCVAVPSGFDGSREFAKKAREIYPNEYEFQYYYGLSLMVIVARQGSDGKYVTRVKSDPGAYEAQLELLRTHWPQKAAPYYLLMIQYMQKDKEKCRAYAKKYIELEKKPFRINWINQAKEVLR